MEIESSETNLVITTKRDRLKLFCKLYWKTFLVIITPLMFLPIIVTAENNAYTCLFVILVTAVYWIGDVLHPGVIALVPVALYSLLNSEEKNYIYQIRIGNDLLHCLGVMIIILAIEQSNVYRRLAVKLLLTCGCSHYRLSFILFFSCTFMAMWVSDIIACGLMMPLVKAILLELEKMGILEMHQTIGKAKQKSERHEQKNPRPTDFTIFYFLGIAYSSSIGSMASIIGSQTNQILKQFCESMFPMGPKIEFPQIILLNLPGVLLIETLLYMWMNSYFLGMFRAHSDIALEIGITEEEAQYINTLLETQYQQLGNMKFHETIVASVVALTFILQTTASTIFIKSYSPTHGHILISAPILLCVILLFILPINLDYYKFFRRQDWIRNPIPTTQNKACLNWNLVQKNMNWSVLLVIASTRNTFEALKESGLFLEFDKVVVVLKNWPAPVLALIVLLLCKLLTELASNSCVAYCLLPSVAKLSVASGVNPHYLMIAAALACSLPFHLITGSPVNAMVAAYVHIPHWKMISAGLGPSVIASLVTWFTVVVWSRAIWTDIHLSPEWVTYKVPGDLLI